MAIDLMDSPVDVKLVIPGPIDTEIWEIETIEAPLYDGPKVPASECAAGIAAAIENQGFEFYVPDMKAVAVGKTGDVDAFLRGAAQLGRR